MTVSADEFIRRFPIHTLPAGFRRIRHFGFLANRFRKEKLALCRKLLADPVTELLPAPAQPGNRRTVRPRRSSAVQVPHGHPDPQPAPRRGRHLPGRSVPDAPPESHQNPSTSTFRVTSVR